MRTDKAAQLEELRKLEKMCENGHGYASKIKRKRRRKRGRGRKNGGCGGKEKAEGRCGHRPLRSERGSELFPALTEGGKELWNTERHTLYIRVRAYFRRSERY